MKLSKLSVAGLLLTAGLSSSVFCADAQVATGTTPAAMDPNTTAVIQMILANGMESKVADALYEITDNSSYKAERKTHDKLFAKAIELAKKNPAVSMALKNFLIQANAHSAQLNENAQGLSPDVKELIAQFKQADAGHATTLNGMKD